MPNPSLLKHSSFFKLTDVQGCSRISSTCWLLRLAFVFVGVHDYKKENAQVRRRSLSSDADMCTSITYSWLHASSHDGSHTKIVKASSALAVSFGSKVGPTIRVVYLP